MDIKSFKKSIGSNLSTLADNNLSHLCITSEPCMEHGKTLSLTIIDELEGGFTSLCLDCLQQIIFYYNKEN